MSQHPASASFGIGRIIPAEEQGGGVTFHTGCNKYVDLIVWSFEGISNQYPQTKDLFATLAKHRQGKANFGYAEISSDKRLEQALSKSEKGRRFYADLASAAPAITVSSSILGDIDNIANVRILRLSDINDNPMEALDTLYNQIEPASTGARHVIDKIETMNKIIGLRPGIFGISFDVNKVIQMWIDKKRAQLRGR